MSKPKLYGIEHTNRDDKKLWTKNNFNSAFPTSLACWMRDQKIDPVSVKINANSNIETSCNFWSISDLFGSDKTDVFFEFESQFETYANYVEDFDKQEKIDLVVKSTETPKKELRPIEIKLTVVPDSSTVELERKNWAPEIVLRPVSTAYACLNVFHKLKDQSSLIAKNFTHLRKITDWNESDVLRYQESILKILRELLCEYNGSQTPFLMQANWHTQGQKFLLCDNCFDIFVWSDMALLKLILDSAENSQRTNHNKKVGRPMRAASRVFRMFSSLFTTGKVALVQLMRDRGYDKQTDKELSLSGKRLSKYVNHPRLVTPVIKREVLKELILYGGEKYLAPERRLDAAVLDYFSPPRKF